MEDFDEKDIEVCKASQGKKVRGRRDEFENKRVLMERITTTAVTL
jgi:hypothetical protein